MKKLALLLMLYWVPVYAATAPVTATSAAPTPGAACSTVASPSNMIVMDASTGAMFRCNGSTGFWEAWVVAAGADNTHGILIDDNSTACENPPGLKNSLCFIAGTPAKPAVRDTGTNTYQILFTNGGVYGPLTCTTGTCVITANTITGANIALGSDTVGDTMYYNGTDWVRLPAGTAGKCLTMNGGATAPEWTTVVTGGDSVQVNGVNSADPDLRDSGDIAVIRCTGAAAPDAACLAAEDVIYRYVTEAILDGDINNFAGIQLIKLEDIATDSFLGRDTAAAGDVEVLSLATTKTLLGLTTGSNSHGDIAWGVKTATDAAFDTGTEVCAGSGKTCVTTADVLGTAIACGTAHTVIDWWLAFCK